MAGQWSLSIQKLCVTGQILIYRKQNTTAGTVIINNENLRHLHNLSLKSNQQTSCFFTSALSRDFSHVKISARIYF